MWKITYPCVMVQINTVFSACLLCVLQTFAVTDPEAQRKEIDGICVFFVIVGVVSFFTQMLQVAQQLALTWLIAVTLSTAFILSFHQSSKESHRGTFQVEKWIPLSNKEIFYLCSFRSGIESREFMNQIRRITVWWCEGVSDLIKGSFLHVSAGLCLCQVWRAADPQVKANRFQSHAWARNWLVWWSQEQPWGAHHSSGNWCLASARGES